METRINRVSAIRWRVREFRQSLRFLMWRVSFSLRAAWLGYRIRHEF